MTEPARCSSCGVPLDPSGPGGLCPACLLNLGLAAAIGATGAQALAGTTSADGSAESAGAATAVTQAPASDDTAATHLAPGGSLRSLSAADAPRAIGPYRILKMLGQGGMGVVYLAEQEHPIRRQVALKVIKRGMDTSEVVARFESERQALAVMNHENIARVFDAGATDEGRPFFVMEYVPGVPLTEYCDRQRLSNRERLGLFVRVCAAIQHAHQKGIIHRDLKPSNVLVTGDAGVPVPKVIDFGIAKATDRSAADETAFTQYGALVGTPEYMSPEQASMGAEAVDTRTDIYSLGVMLYELLVGVLPFEPDALRRAGFAEVLRIVREVEPAKPSTRISTLGSTAADLAGRRGTDASALGRQLRGDLDWIVLKAIEKDRGRRYASASEFAADIERYMADEPVLASPPSARYRLRKAIRRHRVAVSAGAAIVASLLVGLIVAATMYVQAQRARIEADHQRAVAEQQTGVAQTMYSRAEASRAEADRQRGVAEKQTGVAQQMYARSEVARRDAETQREIADARSYASNIAAANALLKAGRREEARGRLSLAAPALRGWEWNYLYAQFDMSLACLDGDGGSITSLQYTPDGTRLIWTSTLGVVRAAARPGYQRIDMGIRPPSTPESVVAITRDATRYVVAPWTTPLPAPPALYIHTPGKLIDRRPDPGDMPNVRLYAAARTVRAYPAGTTPYRMPPEVPPALRTLSVRDSSAGSTVATVVLPTIGVSAPVSMAGTRPGARPGADLSDLSQILAGVRGIADVQGRWLNTYGGGPLAIVSGAFSADGRLAVFWSWDNVLTVWDVKSGTLVSTLSGHTDGVAQVTFDPEGSAVASASADGTIRLWQVAGGDPVVMTGHEGAVHAVAFSPDGKRLVSGGFDKTVRLWERNGRQNGVLRGHLAGITAVAWSPDGGAIASGATDGFIRLWGVATMREREVLEGHLRPIAALTFSPDGREVASGSNDGWVRIWNARRLTVVRPDDTVVADHVLDLYRFSADTGRVVTAAESSGAIRWWTLDAPGRVTTLGDATTGGLRTRDKAVSALSISQDGRRVVTATQDGLVRLWNLDSSGPPEVLRPQQASAAGGGLPLSATGRARDDTKMVRSLTISRDGSRVAAASIDGAIRIWSAGVDRVMTVDAGTDRPYGMVFSPDGRRLSASVGRSVRVWDTASGRLLHLLDTSPATVTPTTFSSNGRWLAAGCSDERIRVWDAESGQLVAAWRGAGLGQSRSLAFNVAGTRLVALYMSGSVVVWDTKAQQPLLHADVAYAAAAAFTAGDTQIQVRADDGSVTVLDGRPTYDYNADELVRRLYQEFNSSAEVVERIRRDATLPGTLRAAAERVARARGDFADRLWAAAESLARRPGQPAADYQRALSYAETAARMMPAHPQPIEARGLALYRLGRLQDSAEAFRRAVELRGGYDLIDIVFLRMAMLRLGRDQDASRLDNELVSYRFRQQRVDRPIDIEQPWIAELDAIQREIKKK